MNQRIQIPNVTVWSCCWTTEPERIERHIRVLKYCQSIMDCKRMVFFSASPSPTPPGIDLVLIKPEARFNWNVFVNRIVPTEIRDGFAMSVHEDGFPIRPDLWSDDFLRYDYIGSPWPDNVIGNGGFNIESQKLLQEKLLVPFGSYDTHPSDVWVCRTHRLRFENRGISFAPLDLAARFSTELPTQSRPESVPSFGFHGRRDSPAKYAEGWELIRKSESQPSAELSRKSSLNMAVVYIHTTLSGQKGRDYTSRFIKSYRDNPPLLDHKTVIVLNGTKATTNIAIQYSGMPNVQFLEHDNSGYDIGGFQMAARDIPCDMMAFFGQSTYFQRPGWLVRMRDSFLKHGNAQYGAMGNRGNLHVKVWPHIRTTAFWMDPKLMNSYPDVISTPEMRHPFEHGPNCFTGWIASRGIKSWVVTWNDELLWEDWDSDPNGYSRGDQSSMLAGDRMCERPYFTPTTRQGAPSAKQEPGNRLFRREPSRPSRDRHESAIQKVAPPQGNDIRRGTGYQLSRPKPGESSPYRCWG